jgi:hypothetical protein
MRGRTPSCYYSPPPVHSVAADAVKTVLHELRKPEAGDADVDAFMQQHDVPHARVVRADARGRRTRTCAPRSAHSSRLRSRSSSPRRASVRRSRRSSGVSAAPQPRRRARRASLCARHLCGPRGAALADSRGRSRLTPSTLIRRVHLRLVSWMTIQFAHIYHCSNQLEKPTPSADHLVRDQDSDSGLRIELHIWVIVRRRKTIVTVTRSH